MTACLMLFSQFSELFQYLSGLEMKKDKLMDYSGDSATSLKELIDMRIIQYH